MRLQRPEVGALVQIRPSIKTLPVFRRVGIDNVLSDLPETFKRVQSRTLVVQLLVDSVRGIFGNMEVSAALQISFIR